MHSASRFRELLGRLTSFKVEDWGPNSAEPDLKARATADLSEAHVTSSLIKDSTFVPKEENPDTFGGLLDDLLGANKVLGGRHHVVLDIDHPVHIEESSTPGNYHLFVEIANGVPWRDYLNFLRAAKQIGLIEPGYLAASEHRGHTDVRLPWVRKEEGNLSIDQQKEAARKTFAADHIEPF